MADPDQAPLPGSSNTRKPEWNSDLPPPPMHPSALNSGATGSTTKKVKKKRKKKKDVGQQAEQAEAPAAAAQQPSKTAKRLNPNHPRPNVELDRIKQFWQSLSSQEQLGLVRLQKGALLKRMKEQQKNTCSCNVCTRRRLDMESELEAMHEQFLAELEQWETERQARALSSPRADRGATVNNCLTIQHNTLQLADHLLDNNGAKFLALLDQLAESRVRLQRVSAAQGTECDQDEDFDEITDFVLSDGEPEELTMDQRVDAGYKLCHILGVKLVEQQLVTAYREQIALEKQKELIAEEEAEGRAQRERERIKEEAKEKKRLKREREREKRRAEEAKRAEAEEKRLEAEAQKKQQQQARLKQERLEALRAAEEEARLKLELENKARKAKEKAAEQQQAKAAASIAAKAKVDAKAPTTSPTAPNTARNGRVEPQLPDPTASSASTRRKSRRKGAAAAAAAAKAAAPAPITPVPQASQAASSLVHATNNHQGGSSATVRSGPGPYTKPAATRSNSAASNGPGFVASAAVAQWPTPAAAAATTSDNAAPARSGARKSAPVSPRPAGNAWAGAHAQQHQQHHQQQQQQQRQSPQEPQGDRLGQLQPTTAPIDVPQQNLSPPLPQSLPSLDPQSQSFPRPGPIGPPRNARAPSASPAAVSSAASPQLGGHVPGSPIDQGFVAPPDFAAAHTGHPLFNSFLFADGVGQYQQASQAPIGTGRKSTTGNALTPSTWSAMPNGGFSDADAAAAWGSGALPGTPAIWAAPLTPADGLVAANASAADWPHSVTPPHGAPW